MPRRKETLENARRPSDLVAVGVLEIVFPRKKVEGVVGRHGKEGQRHRLLPPALVVYLVISSYLYMGVSQSEVLRLLLEAFVWLTLRLPKVADKGAITKARKRLGWEVMESLYREEAGPLAEPETKGAWYKGLRIVALDGTTLDLADTEEIRERFGGPKNASGACSYPQVRAAALCETGTRAIFGLNFGHYDTSEVELSQELLPLLGPGTLLTADRYFYSYVFWGQLGETGTHVLLRVKKGLKLTVKKALEDGSYISKIVPCDKTRKAHGIPRGDSLEVRVIRYRLTHEDGTEETVRLITDLLDPVKYPAKELIDLYECRWDIETAFDELKTHLKGSRLLLRSKLPDLVMQDIYGLLLAHFAIRHTMHQAALKGEVEPNRLSFVHARNAVKRRAVMLAAFSPSDDK